MIAEWIITLLMTLPTPADSAVKKGKDSVRVYKSNQAVVVYGTGTNNGNSIDVVKQTLNSSDDVISMVQGVTMMRRANFAQEPSIRGLSAGEICVTIDGMKMHSACTDRMDPISAYVEIENMRRLEVNKGATDVTNGQSVGGTMNFVTQHADVSTPLFYRAEGGYESVSNLRRARAEANIATTNEKFAVRATTSIKRSGDYSAGEATRIANSGYAKENYLLDAAWRINGSSQLGAMMIADAARNIGYPALIMDASKTMAYIGAMEFKTTGISELISQMNCKLYWNTVEHTMDDYKRSVEEITTRVIMPNMYMPMVGTSQTTGLLANATSVAESSLVKLTVDLYMLNANATMRMIPLDNKPEMFLHNLGDITLTNSALAGEYIYQPSAVLSFQTQARFDYTSRFINDASAKRTLESYLNTTIDTRTYFLYSVNAAATWQALEEVSVTAVAARSMRAPTHIENFGYYLYNPMDNSVYIGNPFIKPSVSYQAEVKADYVTEDIALSSAVFMYTIQDYIAGVTFVEADTTNLLFKQAFRRYDNIGSAQLLGAEFNGTVALTESIQALFAAKVQSGKSIRYNESLPFMPPAECDVRLSYKQEGWWAEIGCRFVAAQNSISSVILHEDVTKGFAVADMRFGVAVLSHVTVKAGIENILDSLYHEHFSINNLPSRGRNFYANVAYTY
ncbi:MAG: TonB-dependent receptor [Candidatus Kapabacteria bacterium]|nr:TonB-dependent receptor [Candidatus Kapabacteria bacterium]